MIAEILEHESDAPTFPDSLRRLRGVRSVSVELVQGPDGDHYPRVGISTPGGYSSRGLRADGPERIELFDDVVHEKRSGSTADVGESWIRAVVSDQVLRALHLIAYHRLEGTDVHGEDDVIRLALETYLREHADLHELPDRDLPEGFAELFEPDSDGSETDEKNHIDAVIEELREYFAAGKEAKWLEDLVDEVDSFELEHVEALEEHTNIPGSEAVCEDVRQLRFHVCEAENSGFVRRAFEKYYKIPPVGVETGDPPDFGDGGDVSADS